jgi:hypothetical protein
MRLIEKIETATPAASRREAPCDYSSSEFGINLWHKQIGSFSRIPCKAGPNERRHLKEGEAIFRDFTFARQLNALRGIAMIGVAPIH